MAVCLASLLAVEGTPTMQGPTNFTIESTKDSLTYYYHAQGLVQGEYVVNKLTSSNFAIDTSGSVDSYTADIKAVNHYGNGRLVDSLDSCFMYVMQDSSDISQLDFECGCRRISYTNHDINNRRHI